MHLAFNISARLSNFEARLNDLKLDWSDTIIPNLISSLVYGLRSNFLLHDMHQIVQNTANHQALNPITLKCPPAAPDPRLAPSSAFYWTNVDTRD
jgi:hypothetical protein